jgi:hypothetical protein
MLEQIGTLVKGANVENIPLGNRSRRKNILQSFRIFYSLATGGIDEGFALDATVVP